MPSSDALLREKEFWPYYCALDDEEPEVDAGLADQYSETDGGQGFRSFTILLDCGGRYYFRVAISAEHWNLSLNLFDARDNQLSPVGWWDVARWHPFGLRWEEFEVLWSFWKRHPSLKQSADLYALLLAKFVGIPLSDASGLQTARAKIEPVYHQLGYSPDKARLLAAATIVSPTESDYAWSKDQELGWVFGGEYSCYSLRNRDHSDGKEGSFPFQKLQQLLVSLRRPGL